MNDYAVLDRDGIVRNVVRLSDENVWDPGEGFSLELVYSDKEEEDPSYHPPLSIGGTYDAETNAYTPPPAPPLPIDERVSLLEQPVQRIAEAFAQQEEAARTALASEGLEEGEPWRSPSGYHDTYPLDWVVTHNGKQWRSRVMGNAWEPGVSGWEEILAEGEIPEWRQPHAGEEYAPGAQVAHNGHLWTNVHTGPNGWEPGVPGSQWRDDGPVT